MGKPAAALETWRASEECIHCGSDAFHSGWGPNTFIQCDCCLDRGTHVGCHEKATGRALSREAFEAPNFQWFCCHVSQRWTARCLLFRLVQEHAGSPAVMQSTGGIHCGCATLRGTR